MELRTNFFNHDAQAGGFFPKSHVGIDIESLAQTQNVLIEGIRGTGKTHVLKMLEKHYLDNFNELRVLPVYVSLAQISEHARKDPEEFRLHLCTHIVKQAVETIVKNKFTLQTDQNALKRALVALRNLFGLKTEPDINEIIEQIHQVAEELRFQLQFDLSSKSLKKMVSESDALETANHVSGALNGKVVKVSGQSGTTAAKSTSSVDEDVLTYVGGRLAHRNAVAFILEFLKQIQIMLNLEYSALLIDECAEASFPAQIEVFRLFKGIRGAIPSAPDKSSCCFFVGTVYPQGETYYPTREKEDLMLKQTS